VKRRFVLVPIGSTGDVLPFVWLAEGLAAAGHEVVAVVHAPFRSLFPTRGLRTVAYGTSDDFDVMVRHPDLWHPRRGFKLIARVGEPIHRHALPLIRQAFVPERTTLVGAALAFSARIAAEALGAPLVTVQLQPMALLSLFSPPVLRAGWERFATRPLWIRRLVYRLIYWQTDWLLAEPINTLRGEMGLPHPVKCILRDYWHSPQRVLGLFPDWYGPRAADWPSQTVATRFPLADSRDADPSPELETFLREGTPPVVFTPGSANAQASRFFEVAAAACRKVGWRSVMITPFQEQLPGGLPTSVLPFTRTSFARLFPRCRAVVHHGGIGTIAQAFAAGVPQLIMPLSHDQPDNASRVLGLKAGDYLYPDAFTADSVADRLQHLTKSTAVSQACRDVKNRMRTQMSREEVLRIIEETR
jgi:UDP:flavonoid glycosyltransferase YjiC (YdhE family)